MLLRIWKTQAGISFDFSANLFDCIRSGWVSNTSEQSFFEELPQIAFQWSAIIVYRERSGKKRKAIIVMKSEFVAAGFASSLSLWQFTSFLINLILVVIEWNYPQLCCKGEPFWHRRRPATDSLLTS